MRIEIRDKGKKFTNTEKKFYRRVIKETIKEIGQPLWHNEKLIVNLVRAKKYLSGYAFLNRPFVTLRFIKRIECHKEIKHLIRHELQHCYGMAHKDGMEEWPCRCQWNKFNSTCHECGKFFKLKKQYNDHLVLATKEQQAKIAKNYKEENNAYVVKYGNVTERIFKDNTQCPKRWERLAQ